MSLIRSGWTEDRIAAALRVSVRTVQRYRKATADMANQARSECGSLVADMARVAR